MPSPSRHPNDSASPSSARKTSWSPANSETKARSICRFSLTKESKLFIFSGGWCRPPIDGVCSLIVLLLTCFFGERRKKGGDLRPVTNEQIISPVSAECISQRAILRDTRAFLAVGYAILTRFALCGRRHRLLTLGNAPAKTSSEKAFNRCAGAQRMASCTVSTRWRKRELAIRKGGGRPVSAEVKNKALVREFFEEAWVKGNRRLRVAQERERIEVGEAHRLPLDVHPNLFVVIHPE